MFTIYILAFLNSYFILNLDAVRSNRRMDNADEKLMEFAIKDWLKNAKKRSAKDKLRFFIICNF